MTDPDETGPQKTHCGHCLVKNHLRCRWLTNGVDCGCDCPWLQADIREHFPSLRRFWLEENPVTAAALMIDVSSNNPVPDLKKHYKAGHRVIALKATEGPGYAWSEHGRLADQWHKLGGAVWHYHFARPGDAKQQAHYFLGMTAAHWHTGDRIVLDVETAGVGPAFVRDFIAFCASRHSPRPGIVYSYASFLTAAKIKPSHGWGLWLADYNATQPKPVAGWTHLTAWQFTDKARGIGGEPGSVDESHLLDPSVIPAPSPAKESPAMNIALRYLKAHVALIGAGVTWALATFPPNSQAYHIVTAITAVLTALGVAVVPNKKAKKARP